MDVSDASEFDLLKPCGFLPWPQSDSCVTPCKIECAVSESFVVRCALCEILRLRRGGLLIIGLPCSSFCRPCRTYCILINLTCKSLVQFAACMCCMPTGRAQANHERSVLFPLGNIGFSFVRCGNSLCSRVVLLMQAALSVKARILLEQPAQSTAPLHPRLADFMAEFVIFVVRIYHKNYQAETLKPQSWWSNDEYILKRLWLHAGGFPSSQPGEASVQLVSRKTSEVSGRTWWSGNGLLKGSQCAPASLLAHRACADIHTKVVHCLLRQAPRSDSCGCLSDGVSGTCIPPTLGQNAKLAWSFVARMPARRRLAACPGRRRRSWRTSRTSSSSRTFIESKMLLSMNCSLRRQSAGLP